MASCHGLDNKEHPSVISPDGHISVSLQQDAAGRIGLSVCRNDSVVLNVMNIGMEVRQDVALDSGFQIVDVHYSSCDSVWSQPWGENKEIREHYNAMSFVLHNDMSVMILEVKVFDDGLGFRYRYDMKGCDTLTLMAELTRFSFAHDGVSPPISRAMSSFTVTSLCLRPRMPIRPLRYISPMVCIVRSMKPIYAILPR